MPCVTGGGQSAAAAAGRDAMVSAKPLRSGIQLAGVRFDTFFMMFGRW